MKVGIEKLSRYLSMSLIFLLFLLQACATAPISKTLNLEHPPRLGIIGFKITAPVKHLSSIMSNAPENLNRSEETALIDKRLHDVQEKATGLLICDLKKEQTLEPVPIPEGLFGTHPGERPTTAQMDLLKRELKVDAILYGRIPWYGRTKLIYPVLGESLDISAETVILGFATGWNPAAIFGNIGFELVTSTPLWFGGYYIFGWAFRPVTVEAWVLSTSDGKEIWHKSIDRLVSGKELKNYSESERHKKEFQLEASLRRAVNSLAKSLSR